MQLYPVTHVPNVKPARCCRIAAATANKLSRSPERCWQSNACLETDCMVLVNLWEAMDDQRSAINLILRDIRIISRSFNEFTFAFANRDCNRVAHLCARQVSHDREKRHNNSRLAIHELLAKDCNSETI